MLEIKQSELEEVYNIKLSKGEYFIEKESNYYKLYIVKDDTAGCILLGENKVKGKVINSTPYEIKLVELMKDAIDRGEEITITVK